jgi:hypothetical protein
MNWKIVFISCCLFALLAMPGEPQVSARERMDEKGRNVAVPAQSGTLLRPILDEMQKGTEHDESRLSSLLYGLTQKKGTAADEALV